MISMKHNPIYKMVTALCLALLTGCTENERMTYENKPCVYFNSVTEADSIPYSFAAVITDTATVSVPLKIIGEATDKDRIVAFQAAPASTAKAGVHYTLPEAEVKLPAGQVTTEIPVKVYNKELETGDVSLILKLVPNADFDLGYSDRLTARVVITNQLVKPSYWRILSIYYGAYSKAKHRLCIQIQGFDFEPKLRGSMIQTYMSYGRLVYNYLLKTPIWDEETKHWITADWSPL